MYIHYSKLEYSMEHDHRVKKCYEHTSFFFLSSSFLFFSSRIWARRCFLRSSSAFRSLFSDIFDRGKGEICVQKHMTVTLVQDFSWTNSVMFRHIWTTNQWAFSNSTFWCTAKSENRLTYITDAKHDAKWGLFVKWEDNENVFRVCFTIQSVRWLINKQLTWNEQWVAYDKCNWDN